MGSEGPGRLCAVLRADMVGSTDLLATRGVEMSIETRRRFVDLMRQICTAGHVLDTRGDGALVGFHSAQSAVAAAWSLQQEMIDVDEFEVRVAVVIAEVAAEVAADASAALGEVERRSDEVEAMCPPGAVVVDDLTRRATRGAHGLVYEPLDGLAGAHRVGSGVVHDATASEVGLHAVVFTDLAEPVDDATAASARSISEAAIKAAGGTIVDTNGAGHVALFPTCSSALDAATSVHQRSASAQLRADATSELVFRVGVSVGDVVTSAGDGFGLAVVEAARLLEHCSAGATVYSRDVGAIAGTTNLDAADLGVVALKGLPEPTDVMRLDAGGSARALLDLPLVFRRDQTFPLVGRESDLGSLDRLWREAVHGDVRAAVVSGEEGVGKTRLVRELARIAHEAGATVLYGACDEDLRVPYAPIAEALSRAASTDPTLAEAVERGAGPLGLLLGSADAVAQRHDGELHQRGADQFELFDAVTSAFNRLATQRPVLLVVDDVQWGELDTLRMIEHVVTRSEASRVMIVATCRVENLDRDHPAQVLLQATRPGHRVDHRRLDRLSTADVVGMLESRTDAELVGDQIQFAAKIAEITGGSPLYIEELVVHLASTEVLVDDPERGWSLTVDTDDVPIPDSIIDLMAQRSERLGGDAVEVLATAAVMGSSFDIEVLSEVTGRDLATVLNVVEAAERARLVRESEAGGTCTFTDEISRAALLRGLRPSRRALVHQSVAEAIERIRPHLIDQLAAHWSAAIGVGARTKAVRYLRLAGERDMASAAWESSAERHRRVLEVLAADAADDVAVLGDVCYRLGASLRKVGDETFRPHLLRAGELARQGGDADLLARSAFAMMRPGAWYPEAAVVDDDIVAMCEDALLLLAAGDPLRTSVLAALATNLTYGGDPDRRWALIVEAQKLATESGDLRLLGTTLAAELISFHEPDRFVRRRELADEVRRIGRATGDRDLLFTGSWFLILDLVQAGEAEVAGPLVEELREVVEATREYWPSFLVSHFQTAMSIARCEADAAEKIEDERSRFEHQPVDWFGVSVIQQATVAMGHGTLSDMLLPFAQAAGEHEGDSWAEKWNYAFSKAYLDAGEYEKALDAIAVNPEPDFDNYWLASTYHLGLVGLLVERHDICRAVIGKLEMFRGRFSIIGLGACVSGQVSTSLGQAYLGLGELDLAEELFRESAERSDRVGFPYFATNARRFLAQTLIQRGGRDAEAAQLLDTVLEASARFGFGLEQREAQLLLDQLGRKPVA